jgi:phosphoenolpyruvate carboxykinase (ATP)
MDVRHALQASLGLETVRYRYELSPSQLFHEAIANDRGRVRTGGGDAERKAFATRQGVQGPLVFHSDPSCTGRPVQDTFAVAWPEVERRIWWKDSLKPFDPDHFEPLLKRIAAHLNASGATLYVQDGCVGVDPAYAVPYRFVGEYATHALFARNMFPRHVPGLVNPEAKRWTMLNVQSYRCEPERDGTRTDRAVILDFRNRICLVVGRADYCGIVKKSIFTVMNFLLPDAGHLSMHCSSNIGSRDDPAIMFGLSGTGKTTLSADPNRRLIGDDETGWTDEGLSNLEDGCYAKLINLDKDAEPVIASALSMPGTIIENVPSLRGRAFDDTDPQDLDLSDASITENTRFSYPLACNPNVAEGARGGHPATIVLLTADAFGVLPPVSILDGEDVMYHFVQGFTAKLAGTEVGLEEPEATFSSCFGAPFMTHRPNVYAELLRAKMDRHRARCILLNTGWSGGAVGQADRMPIRVTRALLDAALAGRLHEDGAEYETHPVFNLRMPKHCPGVDSKSLNPRAVWPDVAAYDVAATRLRDMFRKNFKDNGFAGFGIQAVM